MHETAVVTGLLNILTRQAAEHGIVAITEVRLKVGRLRGLDTRQLRAAFETFAEGGPAEGARLAVDEVGITARCRACGTEFAVEGWRFVCPTCEGTDAETLTGRELHVESFDGTRKPAADV
jgi:hydrogenase nickel incorporation protein HypA/HybF